MPSDTQLEENAERFKCLLEGEDTVQINFHTKNGTFSGICSIDALAMVLHPVARDNHGEESRKECWQEGGYQEGGVKETTQTAADADSV